MAKSRLQISRSKIIEYFDNLPKRVFTASELAKHFAQQRNPWQLAQNTSAKAFIQYLTDLRKLRKTEFPFPVPYKKKTIYSWGEVPFYEIVLGISSKSYFSHYSAVNIHGLTEQIPKTYYINEEQKLESWLAGKLTQTSIDAAFKRPVRTTSRIAESQEFRVVFLNGKNTGNLGVIDEEFSRSSIENFGRVRVTNLERTLIDITVRPVYSGGVSEVLKAFETAKGQVSSNRLAAMLKKMAFIYPYHQAIGFYLERAGYEAAAIDLFRKMPREFDFYLQHNLKEKEYVKGWRLFIPKGL